jgi:hypothetical protein
MAGLSRNPGEFGRSFLTGGCIMKKAFGLILVLASVGIFGLAPEVRANDVSQNSITAAVSAGSQWQRDRYGRRVYNRRRSVTRSRVVRVGRRLYRETFVVSYLPNGRILNTRLISRVRIG